jgi:hypothetical protein
MRKKEVDQTQHKPQGPFSKVIKKSRNVTDYKGKKNTTVAVLDASQIIVNIFSHIHSPERLLSFCYIQTPTKRCCLWSKSSPFSYHTTSLQIISDMKQSTF